MPAGWRSIEAMSTNKLGLLLAEIEVSLEIARKAMAASKAPKETNAEAQLMINHAQEIFDAVTKDGSSGVHSPNYTRQHAHSDVLDFGSAAKVAAFANG
jgi:hypothetical protein